MARRIGMIAALLLTASLVSYEYPIARADSTPSTNDLAPVSSIQTGITGPPDMAFMAQEAKYHKIPLTGTNKWHGFFLQTGRDVTITLPMIRPIDSVSIQFEQYGPYGNFYPQEVQFEVNVDGQWFLADTVKTKTPTWNTQSSEQTFTGNFHDIKSNQVRIHFPVDGWVFARQIHVNALNYTDTTPQPLPNLPKAGGQYTAPMTADDLRSKSIHNMLLAYTGDNGSQGVWSTSDFLPMVAYMSRSGQIQGRMFDSMLFLPYGTVPDTQVAWQAYLDDLFTKGKQLDALDMAVLKANVALRKSDPQALDFREKVVIALPYPRFGDGQWGSVGTTAESFRPVSGDPDALNARAEALNWYIQTAVQKWHAANLHNLELVGFYWLNEKVNLSARADTALIGSAVGAAHGMQLPIFWIPFYDASGIGDWQTLGFNAAWLQPNYIEGGKQADVQRLSNAEALATDYGFGLEVEMPWQVLSDKTYYDLYMTELNKLEKDGMAGKVSHAFYAGSKVLVQAAYSNAGIVRSVYDYTHQFIAHP